MSSELDIKCNIFDGFMTLACVIVGIVKSFNYSKLMGSAIITVKSSGFYDLSGSASAEIAINGQEVGFDKYKIGINIAVFDETSGGVLATTHFNTTVKPNDDLYADYINSLPAGRIVALAVYGSCIPEGGLSDKAIEASKSISSAQVESVQPNYAWALIGIKGQPGSNNEQVSWPHAEASKTIEVEGSGPIPGKPKKLEFKQKLWVGDRSQSFGHSVAIKEGQALVGAYKADIPGKIDAGSAYIYNLDYDQWQPQQRLIADDLNAYDYFGWSVAINKNTAVVGAYLKEGFNNLANAGAAYVYSLGNGAWFKKQKLQPLDLSANDNLGYSVAVDQNLVVVGAYLAEGYSRSNAGCAYIFQLQEDSTWRQIQRLQPLDLVANDNFGRSVAISGNVVIAGAHLAEAPSKANAGAAYIFASENGQWVQKQKLQPEDLAANDYFGFSVAINGNVAIVGSYLAEAYNKANAGAAYIFALENGEWVQKQKLQPTELEANDYFGYSVSVSGDMIIVGAYLSKAVGKAYAGAVYVFQKDTDGVWKQKQKLQPSDLNSSDKFGAVVSINGNLAIVGTEKDFATIYDVVPEA